MQDLRVAGIQHNIVWKNKQANFDALSKTMEGLAVDLIVLPEMFQTGFCFDKEELAEEMAHSETLEWLKAKAAELQAVVTGSFIVKEEGYFYNRLVWMRPDGTFNTYDKRHLFSMSDEPQHFSAGTEKLVVDLNGWKVCPMICYDLRFPVWIRNKELYDLLIFVANWPQRRSTHWEKLLQARSIENQCYTLGVNRNGYDGNEIYHDGKSAMITPMGDIAQDISDKSGIVLQELQANEIKKTRRYMPFLKDADSFNLG